MNSSFAMTGLTGSTYRNLLRQQIKKTKPTAFGMAVAYVSVNGFRMVRTILEDHKVREVRLVTDTKDGITHPMALQQAMDSGWKVRVVDSLAGTFHPKLYVGATAFNTGIGLSGLSLAIVGSPNLSRGGLLSNGECTFCSNSLKASASAARAWRECWSIGTPLTKTKLHEYEKYFALRNRNRQPADLVTFGIADAALSITSGKVSGTPSRTEEKTVSESVASVAWAGLQSFTGEYNLQLEFPKEAGLVLRRVFGKPSKDGSVNIVCADHNARKFKYKYYDHNGMFRLNIPNSTPLVDWARAHKNGIAYVEYDEDANDLYFEIVQPGQTMQEIVDRSRLLGTYGRTTTRLYGWY